MKQTSSKCLSLIAGPASIYRNVSFVLHKVEYLCFANRREVAHHVTNTNSF